MSRVLILPIDDRPCHTQFILDATKHMKDVVIDMVPQELLGHFTRAGNSNQMAKYLLDQCLEADTLIVSVDGLLYGGLVQSRTMMGQSSMSDYESLLDTLKMIKARKPSIKILAYSVIVRLTTTVTDSSQLQVWEDIFEYSQLVHRVQIDPSYQDQFDIVKNRIPEQALEDYLQARQRNHHFNMRCIELVGEGVIDYLSLVQEDTHAFGMHVAEQEILQKAIDENQLNDVVSIKNGTDEMVALLLARDLNPGNVSFELDLEHVAKNYVAKFEDRSIHENIHRAFQVANLSPRNDANSVFLVTPAENETIDLAFEPLPETMKLSQEQLESYTKHDGKELFILDIQCGNGGDIRVLEALLEKLPHSNLKGYSAWNTGSNSIGTLVLDLVIAHRKASNDTYIQHRIIDDALYQGNVRPQINKAMKDMGLDVWAENHSDALNELLTESLNQEIQKHPILANVSIKACLPWGRSFEVLLKENHNEEL